MAKKKSGKNSRLGQLGREALVWLGGGLLKLLYSTYRVRLLQPEVETELLVSGEPVVGASWHRCALILPMRFGRFKPCMMVSPSRDGDLLAKFLTRLGYTCFRGSSTRGGQKAMREMMRYIRTGVGIGATAADGPTGPPYQAKKGMVFLAMMTRANLLPIVYSADRCWVLRKAWDRTTIPKPFARVYINTGKVMRFAAKMSDQEVEEARAALEAELNRILAEVDEITGYKDPD